AGQNVREIVEGDDLGRAALLTGEGELVLAEEVDVAAAEGARRSVREGAVARGDVGVLTQAGHRGKAARHPAEPLLASHLEPLLAREEAASDVEARPHELPVCQVAQGREVGRLDPERGGE